MVDLERFARGAAAALALILAPSPTAAAPDAGTSPVSLEAAAEALDAGDLAALSRAASDPDLVDALRSGDPDTLIELQLALAAAYAEAGLKAEAIAAYEQALMSMLQFRGQGHITMVEPLEAVAGLSDDAQVRARWLDAAFDIREAVWGPGNPHLEPYRRALNAALAAAGRPARPGYAGMRAGEPNFDLVNVYYATHRAATGQAEASGVFSGRRGPLAFGVAEVSVPLNRAPGEIPRPSIWRFEFRPDPNRHMVLNSVTPIADRDRFFQRVGAVIDQSQRKEAFVFVHGYNTSFEGAAIRTAQLAVDMNLDGAPILYAWPSRASLLGYAADTRTVADEALLDEVAAFLTDVARRTGAARVHLVAHSMGARVLTRALDRIAADQGGGTPMFHEAVLAAPDVGVDEFEATFPRILPVAERFTLYASRRDRALQVSEQINRMQRVGDARRIIVRDGLQTVDTTAASAGLLGHDDFAGSALADFRAVMWLSLAPERRCVLETAQSERGRYWAFGGGDCPEQEFDEVTQLVRLNGSVEGALARLEADLSRSALAVRETLQRKRARLHAMFEVAAP